MSKPEEKRVQCVLFDLFGTLVDYDAGRTSQSFDETYAAFALVCKDQSQEAFLNAIETVFAGLDAWSLEHKAEFSMHDFARRLFSFFDENATPTQLDDFVLSYTNEWSAAARAVEGVHSFLSNCRKKFRIGVITNTHNAPMVNNLLRAEHLEPFEIVVTSVEHGKPKPDPSIFLSTLKQLELKPEQVVYVGDTYRADFLGATGAGLTCYLIGQHARVPMEFQIPTVLDLPIHLFR